MLTRCKTDYLNDAVLTEAISDDGTPVDAGGIRVEHQRDIVKVSQQECLLVLRLTAPHKCDDAWQAGLMHF